MSTIDQTPCPYDTNGDGDCGKPMCPYCGKHGRVIDRLRRAARDDADVWWYDARASSDLEALCDLADHARAFTDATAEGDIDLAQRLEGSMVAALNRLNGEDSDG